MLANLTPSKTSTAHASPQLAHVTPDPALTDGRSCGRCFPPVLKNQTKTSTVAARFFSPARDEHRALTRAVAPRAGLGTGKKAPKRSQFRFEVPARIAAQGGWCRKGRCDCSPASRKRCEGTLMREPQSNSAVLKHALLQISRSKPRHSTSSGHAHTARAEPS
jgi:hypothetical protein